MAKKCFYSFHYAPDNWRASKIRQIGAIEGSQTVSDNDWETITKGGDKAIEKWIADQMYGKNCTIVLIGAGTAGRKWVNYEISKTWSDNKALLGIYIHNILDRNDKQSARGANPFANFTINEGKTPLSNIVKAYDPPHSDSKQAYGYIADNIESWVDAAISTRKNY